MGHDSTSQYSIGSDMMPVSIFNKEIFRYDTCANGVTYIWTGVPDTIISDSYSITHEFGESSGVSGIHDSLLLT